MIQLSINKKSFVEIPKIFFLLITFILILNYHVYFASSNLSIRFTYPILKPNYFSHHQALQAKRPFQT